MSIMSKNSIVGAIVLGCCLSGQQLAVGACLKPAAAVCYAGGTVSTTSCAPGPGNATVVDTAGIKNDCVVPSPGQAGYDKQQYYTGSCNWTRITTDCAGVVTYTPMSTQVQECTNGSNAQSCFPAGGSGSSE